MSDPRSWRPPEDEGWEKAAEAAKHRRWTRWSGTAVRWGWVAMFVLVGIAIVVGKM